MSLACRRRDRITHDRVGLAGTQTKRQCLPDGYTPERGSTHTHAHKRKNTESCEVNGRWSGLPV